VSHALPSLPIFGSPVFASCCKPFALTDDIPATANSQQPFAVQYSDCGCHYVFGISCSIFDIQVLNFHLFFTKAPKTTPGQTLDGKFTLKTLQTLYLPHSIHPNCSRL
jgi:hypothetical protein